MAVFLLDAYTEKMTKGKKKEPREVILLNIVKILDTIN